ncbi:MAG: low molecular weight phosphatase family protein [Aquificaceae bacterium]
MKIAFVSTHNAVRSIMAESVARKMSRLALLSPEIYSAGVEPAREAPEEVLRLLQEKGYSVENLYPKSLEDIPYNKIDILITLSPEARDNCPYSISHMRREHWVVEDVKLMKEENLLKTLSQIEELVKALFRIN